MVAKIGRSSNLFGTLSYNNTKMEHDKGEILMTNKIIETADGKYSASQLAKSFEPYLLANRNTEKHTLHISLNPHPEDQMSNEKYRQIARQYMNEMGYGDQPFIVFKHTDIDRSHIHIVSVCVDENGRKVSDQFEKMKSMKVCRELEKQHGLIAATYKEREQNDQMFRPVDYRAGNVKSQIASVVRHVSDYYQFQLLGEYNALLSLFNITAEKIEGELQGKPKQGLLFFPLNEKGEKAGNPFKASLFGKNAGLKALELHFEKSKEALQKHTVKQTLKSAITLALQSGNELSFKKQLAKQGINVVVRKNDTGRVYGMTFIDHQSKTVWNGSRLSKELSANAFNNYWNNNIRPEIEEKPIPQSKMTHSNDMELSPEEPHHLFDFLTPHYAKHEDGLIDALAGLLPEAQGEDYEEQEFASKMKKKRKRKRGKE